MRYGNQRKVQVRNLKKRWRKYALILPKIKILKSWQDRHYSLIYLHQTAQCHDERISHLWDVATNGKHKSKIWRKFEENMPLFRLKSKFWKSDKTGIILGYIFIIFPHSGLSQQQAAYAFLSLHTFLCTKWFALQMCYSHLSGNFWDKSVHTI